MLFKDRTGMKNDRLTLIRCIQRNVNHGSIWKAQCQCGNIILVHSGNFIRTKSCGCLRKEVLSKIKYKHGHRVGTYARCPTPEYQVWGTMIKRCTNPNYHAWKHYGGRGIAVCQRWGEFTNFL